MDKPFSVSFRETKDKIVDVLNGSGLPIDVLDMVLGEIKMVVHAQAEQEYAKHIEAYRKEVEDGQSE